MPTSSLAEQLLNAQVAWLAEEITGDSLAAALERDIDALLDAGTRLTLGQLATPASIRQIARDLFTRVPPTSVASTSVDVIATAVAAGPVTPFALVDVIDREHVEQLIDYALSQHRQVGFVLDELADSPIVAGVAAGVVSRLVTDVVNANKELAGKIPGVGALVNVGAGVAGSTFGAATKGFKGLDGLLGDTAGKGAALATRRLSRVIVDTMKDPRAKAAALEVFDLYGTQPVPTLGPLEDIQALAGVIHDIVIGGSPTEPVLTFVDSLIDGFFEVYADVPLTDLLADLDIDRATVISYGTAVVPTILDGAHAAGELEPLLRARLAPFFESAAVATILG